MGYGVQVDLDALAAGAQRLAVAAETLDTLAGRVLALCAGAGAATGVAELSAALEDAGRAAARAVEEGASVVSVLGLRTGLAGDQYRLLEQALWSRWAVTDGAAPVGGAGRPASDGAG